MSAAQHPFMQRMKKIQSNPFTTHLLYGPSGAGKTTFLASAVSDPRVTPMCVLAFDGGRRSAEGVDPDKVTVMPINNWDDYNEAYDFLSKHGKNHFKAGAVDSLSETGIYSLLQMIDNRIENLEQKDNTDVLRRDETYTEQADYGRSMVQLRRFIRAWRELPMHMFFTALSKEIVVAKYGRVSVPSMFGQMAEEVVGMFDTAVFLALEEQVIKKDGKDTVQQRRILTLQNATNVRVKVRTPFGKRLAEDSIIVPKTGQMTAYLNAIENYV